MKLHVLDIAMDDRLSDNDILCLTKTQCDAGSDTSIIESALQKKYAKHFNNDDNKFKIIAYGLSNDIKILEKEDFNEISIFNIRIQHFGNNPFSTALMCRCPNTKTSAFIDSLNHVVILIFYLEILTYMRLMK